ncbi:unnamed protein product [Meloidogyne enterolobii]|uniref:Uncharacterized protein n=1 Tax=Meloidogyne enterolobii TaxID=390850 RepID=A0ACB0ZGY0_MELEN
MTEFCHHLFSLLNARILCLSFVEKIFVFLLLLNIIFKLNRISLIHSFSSNPLFF